MKDRILGVRIGAGTLEALVTAAREALATRHGPFVFACANPHSLVVARSDAQFRAALEGADAVVADGIGCQWASLLSGVPVGPRITGTDFFLGMMSSLNRRGGRAFFFGASETVLDLLTKRVKLEFPNVSVGAFSPPYRPWSDLENQEMLDQISKFDPDVLWVGMTAPKQEKWVAANAARLSVPVVGSIGAVFGYYAGLTQRAPRWVCKLGLEWLYRLPREPKRLWRRTFVSAPQFLWYVLMERMRS
jgi:N-acetylglucosaminyldiphosphoundecaprenol N-acetyl-beta-D-mannosaminyltransferase